RAVRLLAAEPQALAGVALRVEIDHQDAVAHLRQPERVAGGDGSLAGASLEIEEELAAQGPSRRDAVERRASGGQILHRVGHLLGGPARWDGGMDGATVLGLGQLAHGEPQYFGQPAARVADLLHQRDPPSSTSRLSAARTGSRGCAGVPASGAGACSGGGASVRAAAAAPRTVASSSAASLPARSSTPSA